MTGLVSSKYIWFSSRATVYRQPHLKMVVNDHSEHPLLNDLPIS